MDHLLQGPITAARHPAQNKDVAVPAAGGPSPPLRRLVEEHKWILRWAALIPAFAESADVTTEDGRLRILAGVEFMRSYADRFHQAKEEDVLFQYFAPNLESLRVLRADHEAARNHARAIAEAVEQRDVSEVRARLLAYAALIREHIHKEDGILYPWMDRQLTDTQAANLSATFRWVDEEFGRAPRRQEKFIEELETSLASEPAAGQAGREGSVSADG